MLKTIKLYGELRARFGKIHTLDVATPAEAVRALCVLRPGFRAYMQEHLESPFRVIVGATDVDEKGLTAPVGQAEVIKIIPVVAGAKDGFTTFLIGAAIFAASGGWGTALQVGGGGWLATAGLSIGVSMMLGGVAQLLAKTPESAGSGLDSSRDAETWSFSSPTLTTGQGGCVPLLYGTMRVGGHVISAGIDAQTWQDKGFGGMAPDNAGTRSGDGDTSPWVWAKAEA